MSESRVHLDVVEAEAVEGGQFVLVLADQARAEEWGERAFQVRDPNGVIVELLDWNGSPGSGAVRAG